MQRRRVFRPPERGSKGAPAISRDQDDLQQDVGFAEEQRQVQRPSTTKLDWSRDKDIYGEEGVLELVRTGLSLCSEEEEDEWDAPLPTLTHHGKPSIEPPNVPSEDTNLKQNLGTKRRQALVVKKKARDHNQALVKKEARDHTQERPPRRLDRSSRARSPSPEWQSAPGREADRQPLRCTEAKLRSPDLQTAPAREAERQPRQPRRFTHARSHSPGYRSSAPGEQTNEHRGNAIASLAFARDLAFGRGQADSSTYSKLVHGYVSENSLLMAELCLARMVQSGLKPDSEILMVLFEAYAQHGREEFARQWLLELVKYNEISIAPHVYDFVNRSNAHLPSDQDRSTSGSHITRILENELVLEDLEDLVTWCTERSLLQEAEQWMRSILAKGWEPTVSLYQAVIETALRTRNVAKARLWWDRAAERNLLSTFQDIEHDAPQVEWKEALIAEFTTMLGRPPTKDDFEISFLDVEAEQGNVVAVCSVGSGSKSVVFQSEASLTRKLAEERLFQHLFPAAYSTLRNITSKEQDAIKTEKQSNVVTVAFVQQLLDAGLWPNYGTLQDILWHFSCCDDWKAVFEVIICLIRADSKPQSWRMQSLLKNKRVKQVVEKLFRREPDEGEDSAESRIYRETKERHLPARCIETMLNILCKIDVSMFIERWLALSVSLNVELSPKTRHSVYSRLDSVGLGCKKMFWRAELAAVQDLRASHAPFLSGRALSMKAPDCESRTVLSLADLTNPPSPCVTKSTKRKEAVVHYTEKSSGPCLDAPEKPWQAPPAKPPGVFHSDCHQHALGDSSADDEDCEDLPNLLLRGDAMRTEGRVDEVKGRKVLDAKNAKTKSSEYPLSCPRVMEVLVEIAPCDMAVGDLQAARFLESSSVENQSLNFRIAQAAEENDFTKCMHDFILLLQGGGTPSFSTCNAILYQIVRNSSSEYAAKMLSAMETAGLDPDAETYGWLVKGACLRNAPEEAEKFWLQKMVDCGITPMEDSYAEIIKTYALTHQNTSAWRLWRSCPDNLRSEMQSHRLFNSIIDAFALQKDLVKALEWLDAMEDSGISPNTWTLNSILFVSAKQHDWRKAVDVMNLIRERSLLPNKISFNNVIEACTHAKQLEEAEFWYEEMLKYGHKPNPFALGKIASGFINVGRLEDAERYVAKMTANGIEPTKNLSRSLQNLRRLRDEKR